MNKRNVIFAVMLAAVFLVGQDAFAQVKRVQMHIAGYLCGN